ncbi:hypothetical protein [Papillibacter cinnamivorans]|uniref:Uncharacterized protein n=1 Tax=Papillibacter cinnamivorans DSM 12816 TaxID=1122930 RepID=A0A1W1YGK8_9FIRM|nr:hypothetical protein [Papillibacter cinnamivorans]SMC35289.1 hypothetical protein SAMN02745168_0392 [Papillibacter cinnamivorans DSM 12816]
MIGVENEAVRFERLRRKKDGLAGLLSVMRELEDAVDSYDMPRFLEDLQRCEKAVKRLKDSDGVHMEPEMPPTLREASLVKEIEGLVKQAELLNARTVHQVEENMKFCLSETKRLRRSAKGMYYLKSGFGFPMVEFDKSV